MWEMASAPPVLGLSRSGMPCPALPVYFMGKEHRHHSSTYLLERFEAQQLWCTATATHKGAASCLANLAAYLKELYIITLSPGHLTLLSCMDPPELSQHADLDKLTSGAAFLGGKHACMHVISLQYARTQ